MKSQSFTETFPSIYVPSVINRFIFGHWVLIYFIMQSLFENRRKTYPVFLLSERVCSLPFCLFCQQPQRFLRKQILWNLLLVDTFSCKTELTSSFYLFMWRCLTMTADDVTYRSFINIVGALDHVALNENWNAVFIWSVEICFIYATPLRNSYFVWLHYK